MATSGANTTSSGKVAGKGAVASPATKKLTPPPPSKTHCNACYVQLTTTETTLICVLCKIPFHLRCLNMTSAYYREHSIDLKKSWRCPACTNVTSRRVPRGDDTPARKEIDAAMDVPPSNELALDMVEQVGGQAISEIIGSSKDSVQASAMISLQQFEALIDTKLKTFNTQILQKLDNNKSEIMSSVEKAITNLKTEFTETTDLIFYKLNSLETEFSTLQKKVASLEVESSDLRAQIAKMSKNSQDTSELEDALLQLRGEMNDREQAALSNDLEVSGIPESDGESPEHIFLTLTSKLGMTLLERDVVSVGRVGSRRDAAAAVGDKSKSDRPRPLVVRLSRRALRDDLLKQARVRRGLTTEGLGLPLHTPRNIYVNERLTKANRILLAKTLDASKETKPNRWKYVWTRDGRVLVRHTATAPVYHIRCEQDIQRFISKTTPVEKPQQSL